MPWWFTLAVELVACAWGLLLVSLIVSLHRAVEDLREELRARVAEGTEGEQVNGL